MVINTMEKETTKEDGARTLSPGSIGTQCAEQFTKSEQINVCQCGGALRFGSRDPLEGDYWWCSLCGAGPVLFPIGEGPRPVNGIIDAETANAALVLVAALKRYPVVR
jgi:hypothetical protein